MTDHKGLPVAGYAPTQSSEAVALVNEGKQLEERVRRWFDKIGSNNPRNLPGAGPSHNPRLLVIARTNLELGMAMAYKSVFQPGENRISLPEDKP